MKITQVQTQLYEYELARPLGDVNSPSGRTRACDLAVFIESDDGLMMMELVDAGRDAVFAHDNRVEDGWLVLGERPGIGISFDEDKLEAHAVERPSPGAGPSPWGRRPGAGLYDDGPLSTNN